MSSPSLEFALVRILIDDQSPRKPVGAGFLVTPGHLLTCAHVIDDALGRKQNAAERSDVPVFFDFPLLPGQPLLQAKILHWFPVKANSAVGELEDIAVLELPADATLPAGAQPAPIEVLDHKGSFLNDPVRMCGFPEGVDDGTYANGRLQGRTAKGWVEIHHQDSNLVEAGFSGTAVWAVEENAVCGMTVSMLRRREATVAYMIPALSLLEALPAIDAFNRAANPYRGLKAFREQDARFYFGRNEAADLLRQAANRQPFTAVIGASGSGKSSLVFAGLLPMLSKQGGWLTAACRPKSQPFDELAACLIPFLYEDELEQIRKAKDCAAELLAGKLNLTDLLRPIFSKNSGARLLLIVDQFEELFTLNPDKALVRRYLEGLLAAGQSEGFAALVTMRADFLGAAIAYDLLAEAMNKHRPIMIPPMSGQGLREAVEQPALLLHVRFEPGLAELIVQDVGNEPGSLPLLEFCLAQLWEKQQRRQITHEAYKELGGVQQALAVHADAVIKDFDEQQVRQIFLKLVRPGQGTEDTRQVAALADFQEEQRGLIRQLADRRLLVTSGGADGKEETVEVVHEALIRCWKKLRQWVDKEREFLVWREKLKVLLKQWQESGEMLRGLLLDQALKWRGSHESYLGEEERRFIWESEKAREKQRRRKIAAVSVGLLAVMVVAATFFLLWKSAEKERVRAEEQKHVAEQEKSRAEEQTLEANYNLAKAFEEKALSALKIAEKENSTEVYKKAILFTAVAFEQKIAPQQSVLEPSSVGSLFAPAVFNAALSEIWISPDESIHHGPVTSLSFSPDGKLIASSSDDHTIRIWNTERGKLLHVLYGHTDKVNSVSFSTEDALIVSGSSDETLLIWNAKTGKKLKMLQGHTGKVNSAVFSPDGRLIASASEDKTVRIWDVRTGKMLNTLKQEYIHDNETRIPFAVNSVVFSPDGKQIAVASLAQMIQIWDIETSKILKVLQGHTSAVTSVAFSPDGKKIASTSPDRTTRIWDAETGKELLTIKNDSALIGITNVSFSPDGKQIVTGYRDKTVRISDSRTGEVLKILSTNSVVTNVSFSPDGNRLASASHDGLVRIWSSAVETELSVINTDSEVYWVSFSPDGKRIACASDDGAGLLMAKGVIKIIDSETGEKLMTLKGHSNPVFNVVLNSDGKRIASASNDGTIRVWDSKTGKELLLLTGHDLSVFSVSFSPDGRRVASASQDKTVRIWNSEVGNGYYILANPDQLRVLQGHADAVFSVSFSPDGKKLASASVDKTVRVWDSKTGNELMVLRGHTAEVRGITFSPDGRRIASGSYDKTIRIWDGATGEVLKILIGHTGAIFSVSFSPDGKYLTSASYFDKTVRLWDTETGKELLVMNGHSGFIFNATFSPDGRRIASGDDKTVRLWDLRPYTLFLHGSKPTPLYFTFIEAVKFLWQLDVQGLEIVHKERTPADMERFGSLLAPPPPGQSKFDQVLEWAEKQQAQ